MMKKLITMFAFLIISIYAIGQISIMDATKTMTSEFNETTQEWSEWSEWKDCAVHVTINSKTATIRIDNEYRDMFRLTDCLLIEEVDETEATFAYTSTTFSAVDKDGVFLHIVISESDQTGITAIMVRYSNISYAYKGMVVQIGALVQL